MSRRTPPLPSRLANDVVARCVAELQAATDEVNWLCHAPHGHQIDLGRILWGQANEYPQEILLREGGKPAGLFHLRIT